MDDIRQKDGIVHTQTMKWDKSFGWMKLVTIGWNWPWDEIYYPLMNFFVFMAVICHMTINLIIGWNISHGWNSIMNE